MLAASCVPSGEAVNATRVRVQQHVYQWTIVSVS